MSIQPAPNLGDRVRVTYEGTYLRPSESGGQPRLLVGDNSNDRWHNILPPLATVEVVIPGSLAERMAALADRLDASAEGYGGGKFEGWQQAAVMIREELTASGAQPGPKSAT